jgi:hypothetical protein
MKWIRPSGTSIELKDTPELDQFATASGWTKEKSKRTRRTKAEMEAANERNSRDSD